MEANDPECIKNVPLDAGRTWLCSVPFSLSLSTVLTHYQLSSVIVSMASVRFRQGHISKEPGIQKG
jgi:hypothetical protein